MNCTRCRAAIEKGEKFHRTKVGPHHAMCPSLSAIATRAAKKDGESKAAEWWRAYGIYIDPDTEDVDWYDKRKELKMAQMAFLAGWNARGAL